MQPVAPCGVPVGLIALVGQPSYAAMPAMKSKLSNRKLPKISLGDVMSSKWLATALAAFLLSHLSSTDAEGATGDDWKTWHNSRFAYSMCYPAAVFPVSRESPQKHGIVMESKDSAQLIAVGVKYERKTLAEQVSIERERLTHIALLGTGTDLTNGDTWFVVSGTRVDQVLYTKGILSEGRLIALRFRYPQSLAERYAPLVDRISNCLKVIRDAR